MILVGVVFRHKYCYMSDTFAVDNNIITSVSPHTELCKFAQIGTKGLISRMLAVASRTAC